MHYLVIDDSALARREIAEALLKQGHSFTVVADGEAGWKAFQDGVAEAVITDWQMPGMDGIELANRIRASGSDVPITIETSDPRGAETLASGISNLRVLAFEELLRELRF